MYPQIYFMDHSDPTSKGICPNCYCYILDTYDENVEEKWVIIRTKHGNLELRFKISDLVNEYENEDEIGTIICNKEIPPELPSPYQWVCFKCYNKFREDFANNQKDDHDEQWMDSLDDWR